MTPSRSRALLLAALLALLSTVCALSRYAASTAPPAMPSSASEYSSSSSGTVLEVHSVEELDALLGAQARVLVDFYATWCGPCKRIAPRFAQLAQQHPSVALVKVNIDDVPALAERYAVSAIPTFVAFRDGSEAEDARVLGPDANGLVQLIGRLL